MPVGWAVVVVVQWVAIIALAVVLLGVLRQIAPRLERAEADPPPNIRQQGPGVGAVLPEFAARDAAGGPVTPAHLRGKPNTLLFLSAGCGPCVTLAGELETSGKAGELADPLTVLTDADGVQALRLPDWVRVLTISGAECREQLGVRARPFAIAVDDNGVIKGKRPVNTVAQLTEWMAANANVSAAVPFT